MHKFKMVAKTLKGLEECLADEIRELGGEQITMLGRAVEYWGDKELLYRSNLFLRTALKILKPITTFRASNPDELYEGIKKFPWNTIMSSKDTFAIDGVSFSELFKHTQYIALKTKDAIADQFREREGIRPSVNVFSPKVRLTVYINKDQVEVSLDSSGEPLFKRGYRVESVQAPLNEVLAAGLIAMSGWNNDKILIDPMCGSGTILAEAALKAQNLPSNILRKDYAFQRWNDYEPELWTRTVKSIMDTAKRIKPLIQGADISGQSLKATASNLKRLGLENIKLDQVSFFDSSNTHTQGIIITNPPYDERLELDNAMAFYKEIGNSLKQNFTGFEAWILSGNTDAIKHIGLATSKKIKLVNGAIESTFNKYSLYSGSRKMKSND